MSQFAREHPDDWQERLEQMVEHADRCPHGEDDWHYCEVCREDERGVRIWERSREK